MNTVVIIQARMTSTRLPGKVLLPILDRPMLAFQIERLRRCREIDRLVIATTTNASDDVIVAFCAAAGIDCTRGSEHDVLSRYYEAAQRFAADTVVRVTSDCPLLEPELIDAAVLRYHTTPEHPDYLSNMLEPTWPYGMAVEVFSARSLADAQREATDPAEREHVTPFIYWRPQRYRLYSLKRHDDLSALRLTVDTPEDYELVRRIFTALYPQNPDFTLTDVQALLTAHPDWLEINRHVVQKTVNPQSEDTQ